MKLWIQNLLSIVGVLLCTTTVQAKTASEVFETVSSSIVVVRALDASGKVFAYGSGVVLADGVVATNCHVITKAISLRVLYQGVEHQATPAKTDWERDICTLVMDGFHAPAVSLGATSHLKVGQRVYAVGAPKGLELTLSDGIISSLRQVAGGQYLQITAPISPGSSGGGLFDDEGRLIGLPTFYLDGGQQLNFAVPVEWIKELPLRQASTSKKSESGGASQQTDQLGINWLNKAIVFEKNKDWQGLLNHTQRWAKEEPENVDAWCAMGIAYRESKQFAKSIESYQQAILIDPNLDMAWADMGNAYGKSDQITKAIEAFQKAIDINPDNAHAWYNLGVVYEYSKQIPKAIEALWQAIRINPDIADAWSGLGIAYNELKQYTKSIEAYQQAIRINPDDAKTWYNLGVVYEHSKQIPKSIEAFRQAIRINPDYVNAWYNVGVNYGRSKQIDKSIEAFQQAIRIKSDYVDAWYNLGVAYNISGQKTKVTEVYKRLKTIDSATADKFFNKYVIP